MSRLLRAALIALATLASAPAFASDPDHTRGFANHPFGVGQLLRAWSDCAADRERYCASVPTGGGRVVRCLVDNIDQLTQACHVHAARAVAIADAWSACVPDVEEFCSAVVPGRGRVLSCLAGNRDRLSRTCRDGLDAARDALLR